MLVATATDIFSTDTQQNTGRVQRPRTSSRTHQLTPVGLGQGGSSSRRRDPHTHPVLCQVWRDPKRQTNLTRLIKHIDVQALDESRSVGMLLAVGKTSDVVDAHLAITAEMLGTFVLTADPADMTKLGTRFETY